MHLNTRFFWMLSLLFTIPLAPLSAQQTPYFSLFQENWVLINPATLDHAYLENSYNSILVNSSSSQQWVGFDEGPKQLNLRLEYIPSRNSKSKKNAPLPKWGLGLTHEQLAAFSSTNLYGNFAYSVKLNPSTSLSAGFNVGWLGQGIDLKSGLFEDWSNDKVAQSFNTGKTQSLNVDAGLFLRKLVKTSSRMSNYYLGLSATQIANVNLSKDRAIERRPHLNLLVGSLIKADSRYGNSYLEPSLWIRYLPGLAYFLSSNAKVPVSFDLLMRVHLENQIWFGAGYGSSGNANVAFGYRYVPPQGKGSIKGGLMMNIPSGKSNLGYSMEAFLGLALASK